MGKLEDYQKIEQLSNQDHIIYMGVDFADVGEPGGVGVITIIEKREDGSIKILGANRSKKMKYLEKKMAEHRLAYAGCMVEEGLTDEQLLAGIREKKIEGFSKLGLVKWVWDNCDRNLRDSKEFVDTNGESY